MLTYTKFLFPILLSIFCFSCNKNTTLHQDEYVSFSIPEGAEVDDVQTSFLSGRNYYKEGQYNLTIFEVPIGIASVDSPVFLQAIGCSWLDGVEPTDGEIDGYPVKVYTNVMKGNYDIYTNTYVFSNGEKSVILIESQKNEPGSWWKDNIKWNMPLKSELSLEQRTQQLADFLNDILKQQMGGELQITTDKNNVDVKLIAQANTGLSTHENKVSWAEEGELLRCFDVFNQYMDRKYDINLILMDPSGNEIAKIEFPYDGYLDSFVEEEK